MPLSFQDAVARVTDVKQYGVRFSVDHPLSDFIVESAIVLGIQELNGTKTPQDLWRKVRAARVSRRMDDKAIKSIKQAFNRAKYTIQITGGGVTTDACHLILNDRRAHRPNIKSVSLRKQAYAPYTDIQTYNPNDDSSPLKQLEDKKQAIRNKKNWVSGWLSSVISACVSTGEALVAMRLSGEKDLVTSLSLYGIEALLVNFYLFKISVEVFAKDILIYANYTKAQEENPTPESSTAVAVNAPLLPGQKRQHPVKRLYVNAEGQEVTSNQRKQILGFVSSCILAGVFFGLLSAVDGVLTWETFLDVPDRPKNRTNWVNGMEYTTLQSGKVNYGQCPPWLTYLVITPIAAMTGIAVAALYYRASVELVRERALQIGVQSIINGIVKPTIIVKRPSGREVPVHNEWYRRIFNVAHLHAKTLFVTMAASVSYSIFMDVSSRQSGFFNFVIGAWSNAGAVFNDVLLAIALVVNTLFQIYSMGIVFDYITDFIPRPKYMKVEDNTYLSGQSYLPPALQPIPVLWKQRTTHPHRFRKVMYYGVARLVLLLCAVGNGLGQGKGAEDPIAVNTTQALFGWLLGDMATAFCIIAFFSQSFGPNVQSANEAFSVVNAARGRQNGSTGSHLTTNAASALARHPGNHPLTNGSTTSSRRGSSASVQLAETPRNQRGSRAV